MNGPEHYRDAERLIGIYATQSTTDDEAHLLAEWAQVHATLALATYVREVGDQLDTLPRGAAGGDGRTS